MVNELTSPVFGTLKEPRNESIGCIFHNRLGRPRWKSNIDLLLVKNDEGDDGWIRLGGSRKRTKSGYQRFIQEDEGKIMAV